MKLSKYILPVAVTMIYAVTACQKKSSSHKAEDAAEIIVKEEQVEPITEETTELQPNALTTTTPDPAKSPSTESEVVAVGVSPEVATPKVEKLVLPPPLINLN